MKNTIIIEQITTIEECKMELVDLLIQVVQSDASIGFLPPLSKAESERYWDGVVGPDVILFIATLNNVVVGTVQLHLCAKQNGSHRAEIAKLMTHPDYQRKGIGRLLMQKAEQRAKQEGRTLIVLDTREGDVSNQLYASIGYIQAGRIPGYAISANGERDATVFYYKLLD